MRAVVASLVVYTLQCFHTRVTAASGGRTEKMIKIYDDYNDKASTQTVNVCVRIGNSKETMNLKSE
jgi:hypothetical protein